MTTPSSSAPYSVTIHAGRGWPGTPEWPAEPADPAIGWVEIDPSGGRGGTLRHAFQVTAGDSDELLMVLSQEAADAGGLGSGEPIFGDALVLRDMLVRNSAG